MSLTFFGGCLTLKGIHHSKNIVFLIWRNVPTSSTYRINILWLMCVFFVLTNNQNELWQQREKMDSNILNGIEKSGDFAFWNSKHAEPLIWLHIIYYAWLNHRVFFYHEFPFKWHVNESIIENVDPNIVRFDTKKNLLNKNIGGKSINWNERKIGKLE